MVTPPSVQPPTNTQPAAPLVKPTFEEAYPEINRLVQRRKGSWTYLSIMAWEDVSQILLIRTFDKWNYFDPNKGTLDRWVNTLITRGLMTLRRDNLLRWARPCIGGGKTNGKSCVYNMGGDSCRLTPSKTQCDECPVYKEWREKREAQLHIKSNVALENHTQEVSNIQEDFKDANGVKVWLDKAMLKELTQWERKVYKALFQKYMAPTEASRWLIIEAKKRKRPLREHEQASYQAVLRYNRSFKAMMKEHLRREGHID